MLYICITKYRLLDKPWVFIIHFVFHTSNSKSVPVEIEVDFGFGVSRKFHNINDICLNIPSEFRAGLLFFYSFTGSDLTSSFFSISKPAWWKLWVENVHDMTDTFIKLSHRPANVSEDDFLKLEKFVFQAYDPNHRFKTYEINKLRYLL